MNTQLTKEQIKQMAAGRELDAMVAEKVMKWTRFPEQMHPSDNRTIDSVLYCPPAYPYNSNAANVVPDFSDSITAAWEIVLEMRCRWFEENPNETNFWQFIDCCELGWRVDIVWGHHDGDIPEVRVDADTLPLAICRAALLHAITEKEPA